MVTAKMQWVLLWCASASALVTFAVHTFVGGVFVARPLLSDQGLPKAAKWLAYYCWHVVTLLLFGLALAFAATALGRLASSAALALSAFSALCSLLSIAVARKGRIAPWRFPSTTLFAITAAFGFAATWPAGT
jgi:hypothetical protein